MLADELAEYIQENYPDRDLKIEISEDGENGAVCYYSATEQAPLLYQHGDLYGSKQ